MTDKPDLSRIWAAGAPSGNVVDPDTTTPGKFAAGWQAEVPPFEHFNFIQKHITQSLAYLGENGLSNLGEYASGIEVTTRNQYISDGDIFWRASASTTLPYTTTGAGMPEGGAFVNIGDAVLRQDLAGDPADGLGAVLVKGVVYGLESVEDLKFNGDPTKQYLVQSFYSGANCGGGVFHWDAAGSKSDHDGGNIIDPDHTSLPGETGWWGSVNVGLGVFRRSCSYYLEAVNFGLRTGDTYKNINSEGFNKLLGMSDSGEGVIRFPSGDFYFSNIEHVWTGGNSRKDFGIVGSGKWSTKLFFDNSAASMVMGQSGVAYSLQLLDFSAHPIAGKEQTFDFFYNIGGGGMPRANIQRVLVNEFRRSIELFTWVARIHAVEARLCTQGISIVSGTSIDASNIYSLGCEYGNFIGVRRDPVSGNYFSGGVVYSNFRSCAADDIETGGAYILGQLEGVTITNSGCEKLSGSAVPIHMPKMDVNDDFIRVQSKKRTVVDGMRVTGGTNTPAFLRLGRARANIEINNPRISTTVIGDFIEYENGVTATDPIGVWLKAGDGNLNTVNVHVDQGGVLIKDFSLDGQRYGTVTNLYVSNVKPLIDLAPNTSYVPVSTIIPIETSNRLRLAIAGPDNSLQRMSAKIDLYGMSPSTSPLVTILVSAEAMPNNNSVKMQYAVTGEDFVNINVTTGGSVRNVEGGIKGTDVVIDILNSPGESYLAKIEYMGDPRSADIANLTQLCYRT